MVRIWRVPPQYLCRQRLLGLHKEIHQAFTPLLRRGGGYWNHPEVQRYADNPKALVRLHERVVVAMKERGWNHYSPAPDFETRYKRHAPTEAEVAFDLDDLMGRWQREEKWEVLERAEAERAEILRLGVKPW